MTPFQQLKYQLIPVHQHTSPQLAQPKGWNPPSLLIVPQAFPLPSRGSNTGWIGILLVGTSRILQMQHKFSHQPKHMLLG